MLEAIKLAEQAKDEGNFPFGAVIVKSGEIIGRGRCLEATEKDVTKHAELIAVSEACKALRNRNLSNCVLYASGEPCNMCAAAVFQADIGKVFIGARRDDLPNFFRKRNIGITELAEDSSHKVEIVGGILKDEVIKLFDGVIK